MKNHWILVWGVACGLLFGLLAGGVLYLVSSPPRGDAVQLQPPPTPQPLTVHVTGGVQHPGVYPLERGSRVQDAIVAAGGLLPEVEEQLVNLAAAVQDGQQIVVPQPADKEAVQAPMIPSKGQTIASDSPAPTARPDAAPALDKKININQASLDELDTLPGIGPVTAQAIIDYRTEHGPFSTLEALLDVSGIGPATFERIKPLITLGG